MLSPSCASCSRSALAVHSLLSHVSSSASSGPSSRLSSHAATASPPPAPPPPPLPTPPPPPTTTFELKSEELRARPCSSVRIVDRMAPRRSRSVPEMFVAAEGMAERWSTSDCQTWAYGKAPAASM